MNIQSNKALLTVTLCAVAVLWSCKKGDEQVIPKVSAAYTSTIDAPTGGVVTFTNTSENATSYAWDFGDGNKSTEESPTHTYTKDSTYTVKLTATNAGGSDEETKTIIIKLKGTVTETQLIANFTYELGTEGAVTFKNTSLNATGYAWDFGDGNKSTKESPTHTYTQNGDFDVKLTATNSAGKSDSTTQTVTIDNLVITIAIADLSQLAIQENSPKGTLVGEIAATVANTDETPVYSITSQNPAGAIGLEGNKMVVNEPKLFDHETRTEVTGEIQGTVAGVSATVAFTISITNDVDEAINFPDATFKALLLSINALNTNGDQEISEAEAQAFTGEINGPNRSITDATGLEYFINITGLYLFDNKLTAIDLSNNTKLTHLSLSYNNLTAIDVSQNKALYRLWLDGNKLTKANFANGNNANIFQLRLKNNPNLTCVQVDRLPIPFAWKGEYDSNKVTFQTEACN